MKVSLRKEHDGRLTKPKLNDEPLTVRRDIRLEKLARRSPSDPKYKLIVDEGTDTEYSVFVDKLYYRYKGRYPPEAQPSERLPQLAGDEAAW